MIVAFPSLQLVGRKAEKKIMWHVIRTHFTAQSQRKSNSGTYYYSEPRDDLDLQEGYR